MRWQVPQPTVRTLDGEALPVRRIFCIGKNYADHVAEMGGDPKDTPPVFFTKPADAACQDAVIPFPQCTDDLHYEAELVAVLGGEGRDLPEADAADLIAGYACGCDLTRRDHQRAAKDAGGPWDLAKALDHGAVLGPVVLRGGVLAEGQLRLSLNGEVRQDADLSLMIWSLPEIIARLSHVFALKPGDLVFTGTPAGVGPLAPGYAVEITIADLPPLRFTMGS
ncbi:MAG: fumarylacetoacetate hydrolase family protein [Pseudomonadota bacterium]